MYLLANNRSCEQARWAECNSVHGRIYADLYEQQNHRQAADQGLKGIFRFCSRFLLQRHCAYREDGNGTDRTTSGYRCHGNGTSTYLD